MSWAIILHIDRGLAADRPAAGAVPGRHYGWFSTDTGVLSISDGSSWIDIGGTGIGGAVASVFGRTGAVAAATSDYDADQIDFAPAGSISSTNVQDAIEEVAAEATGGAVSSVFTRTGAVVAAAGDYTAAQVTNTPAGSIAATTVQAALNELDTEKETAGAAAAVAAASVPKTLFDANTILKADSDDTPLALTMGASTILARLAAGGIVAATPAELRTLLALVVGTNVQAWDADLDAIAALASAANKLPYATGAQAWALTDLSAFARTLLDDSDAATARATLGVGSLPPEVPSGTINGSNVTFTLSATPSPSANLLLWKNGLYQLQGTDYTLSGATITMTVAPATGSSLVAAVPTVGTSPAAGIGNSALVYRYTVTGSDKSSIDTGVDTADAGSNDWTNGDLLEVRAYMRTDEAVSLSVCDVILNNDTGANYERSNNQMTNATNAGQTATGESACRLGAVPGASASANVFGSLRLDIPNFSGTVGYKNIPYQESVVDSASAANSRRIVGDFGYQSTSAITRLKLVPETAGKKFKVGTQLLIYKRLAS